MTPLRLLKSNGDTSASRGERRAGTSRPGPLARRHEQADCLSTIFRTRRLIDLGTARRHGGDSCRPTVPKTLRVWRTIGLMKTTRRLTAIIERDDEAYVALCPELDIASQGDTVESARR